ncbi:MAG TPA: tetratricopeptide repeat protein [Tepidisphaeraceae bacterium]|nr:tetratricopeptide repeat protein [Tepidisphaeraceae bacterium]
MRLLALLFVFLGVPSFAAGEVVTLKDGTTLQGELKRSRDGYIVTDAGGRMTTVAFDNVATIDVRPAAGAGSMMSRLQSLRRAADNMADIKQILERYKSFINQSAGTPAADEARKDLQLWADRQRQGFVKAGDQWMTTAQRDAMRSQSTQTAFMLHDLLKQGRFKEAEPMLDKAIAVDPSNMSLLYLRGGLLYEQGKYPLSRKSFEGVLTSAPDHAPTLNNLAAILWRQNARVAALAMYDRALLAAPESRQILDNIAEALNALPKEQRNSPVTKKLIADFKQRDEALARKMSLQGLFRWGAGWITEAEQAKIAAQQKGIDDQIAKIQVDFDAAKGRAIHVEQRIKEIQSEMSAMEAASVVTDGSGRSTRIPYPPQYYMLSQDMSTAQTEYKARVKDMQQLQKQAVQVKAQSPAPTFTGVQTLVDADGMPVPATPRPPMPQPAATQPAATQPGVLHPNTTQPAAGRILPATLPAK